MSEERFGLEQAKALVISGVIKEPRTFEIYSEQMRKMESDQFLELDVLDREGNGSFYPLLTHATASKEGIDHALQHGAVWEEVWVMKGLPNLREFKLASSKLYARKEEEQFVEKAFENFLDTCEHFALAGEPKEQSWMKMSEYDTFMGIFASKQDALDFQEFIQLLSKPNSLSEKEVSLAVFMKRRPEARPFEARYQWEHEM